MSSPRSLTGPRRVRRWAVRLGLAMTLPAAVLLARSLDRPPRPTLAGLATVIARRADFSTTLLANGRTESAANTVVECKLERLEMRNEGRSSMVGGSSVITWVIDDGASVKKGDVLCRLDSSDYEELVRQQEIKVERARADLRTAELDLAVAKLAVDEFRDGLMAQTIQEQEVALSMAESEIERWKARAAWLERMKGKGYASIAQISTADVSLQKAEIDARTARTNLELFRKFGAPKQIPSLEAAVRSDEADLIYCRLRAQRFDERLAYYKQMVADCTVTAPHDGFVIYVQPRFWAGDVAIQAGTRVRQMQDLFYLPDLSRMRVAATIHESLVTRVQPGMRVKARVEGLSGREIEGHVLEVEPLPDAQTSWLSDTRSFKATIALDSAPRGIRPEMSAEVEIALDRRSHVITVPPEAVAVEGGRGYCYVASDGMLTRRPIKLGGANAELLEVTEGLDEGEAVVSDVSGIEAYAPLIVDAPCPTDDDSRPAVAEAEKHESAEKVGF
jgi:HlyD family secretion protein